MRSIVIVAKSAKEAKRLAQQKYPAQWEYIRRDKINHYGMNYYIFRVPYL